MEVPQITMSTCRNHKRAEEPSAPAVGEDEPILGLTVGELMDPSPSSVDPQQSSEVFAKEYLGDLSMRVHGPCQGTPPDFRPELSLASTTLK
ncbi:hypothetical protein M422DRAFT_276187 [Sphaerobolus stellatus SS14]|uniref:Uncharacterized protein n=1 Tax=Sphaerobolus stellatus (strain SS14) TaxID=990650 RepID=A0A0C9UDP9_SPHS4|nr:hypothetical protein M422DRAFT_276187 [Sphaerobolus stellatus SS14]